MEYRRFTVEDGAPGITFSLHGTSGFQVQDPIHLWSGEEFLSWELDAGTYWVVGSYGSPLENSQKLELCIGASCEEPLVEIEEIKETGGCSGQASFWLSFWFCFRWFRDKEKRSY